MTGRGFPDGDFAFSHVAFEFFDLNGSYYLIKYTCIIIAMVTYLMLIEGVSSVNNRF